MGFLDALGTIVKEVAQEAASEMERQRKEEEEKASQNYFAKCRQYSEFFTTVYNTLDDACNVDYSPDNCEALVGWSMYYGSMLNNDFETFQLLFDGDMTEDMYNDFYSDLKGYFIDNFGPVFEDPDTYDSYADSLIPVNMEKVFKAFYEKTMNCVNNMEFISDEELFNMAKKNALWLLDKLRRIILNINAVFLSDYEDYAEF